GLHFEIEICLLFAKILLDKIAQFIEDFFGVARGASLRSHDKWCKAVKEYSQAKGLEMPAGISETMDRLRSVVADYRDKQITHFQNPRAFHVTHITREGATQIGTTALDPKDSDKWSTSPAVGEV